MPEEVEECLLALGPLTAANSPQQKACLQLEGGEDNYHNAVRVFRCGLLLAPQRPRVSGYACPERQHA
jgi:hypothetical protein